MELYCLPRHFNVTSVARVKARFFLQVDLREKKFRIRVGGTKKRKKKKALKMTS